MSHRELCMIGALALGSCGGLATDDGALDGRPWPESERGSGAAPQGGFSGREEPAAPGPVSVAPGVGDACGPGPEQGERVVIGPIVLDTSGNCAAGHLCLMWAAVAATCPVASDGAGCGVVDRDDDLVPVPPSLAPELPGLDRVCTCRCAGGDGDHCTCPEGMSCRELIRSSGVNGAAADFVGSYCLY